MNHNSKRALALITALMLILLAIPMSSAAPAVYSTTQNSGVRHEVCTTLGGTTADAYYTGSNTYDALATLEGDALLSALRALMTSTHKKVTSYNDCRDMSVNTDCQNGDGSIVLLYTSKVVTRDDFIGSGSIGWNREHVWPKSLGGFGNEGAGADLHHVRPDDVTTNAVRANLKYGNVTGGSEAKGSSLVGGASGGTYNSTYFEPHDDVKGDVARICLYVYVRYGGELSKCNRITNVFESVDVLLDWCELDPVDTWEMGRNEVVAQIQGNRNVFIDYPELAFLLFGADVPSDMVTPSGKAQEDVSNDTPGECTHALTELRGQILATCTTEGYSGDTYCLDCGEMTAAGRVLTTDEGHIFGCWVDDGFGNLSRICQSCAKIEMQSNQPEPPAQTGCGAVVSLPLFLFPTLAIGLLAKKKK